MRQSTKYGEIIHHIHGLIEKGRIRPGDGLPSISEISRTLCVARETVVKAYKILKQEGLIDSVPGKGFFLLTDRISTGARVLLILNSFNPYMQVLYNAFSGALPEGAVADIYFHHNNIEHFKALLETYSSRYSHYIIKPFQDSRVPEILDRLEPRKTLILDRGEYIPPGCSSLCQDFSGGISDAFSEILDRIKDFSSLNMIRTPMNPHPEGSFTSFQHFLEENNLQGEILKGFHESYIRKGAAYFILTEQDLVSLLTLASTRDWVPGRDIGILSYNDFPLLEFVSGGITSLSVDFKEMGRLAASFLSLNSVYTKILRPRLIRRSSF